MPTEKYVNRLAKRVSRRLRSLEATIEAQLSAIELAVSDDVRELINTPNTLPHNNHRIAFIYNKKKDSPRDGGSLRYRQPR